MKKTQNRVISADQAPNNHQIIIHALMSGVLSTAEIAERTGLEPDQVRRALAGLSEQGEVEFRRGLDHHGWHLLRSYDCSTRIVKSAKHSLWGVFGYPQGVIPPLAGRVFRMAG